jgi:cytochrome c-type biogenesis protein CcmH
MKKITATLFLAFFLNIANAVDYRQFDDSRQQQLYDSLISELRCLVCQNQTIKDSNAELADDLRRQVYEMIRQGKSKEDIVGFMTDRYGDFVLYKPPFKKITSLLWLGPLIFLTIGFLTAAAFIFKSKKKALAPISLTPEDAEKIRNLLEKGDSL